MTLLSEYISTEQKILMYFTEIEFKPLSFIDISMNNISSIDSGIYVIAGMEVISELKDFSIINLEVAYFDSVNIEVVNVVESISFNDIVVGPFVINYKETERYEVVGAGTSIEIEIPEEIVILGEKKLKDSTVIILDMKGSVTVEVLPSVFHEVFTGAVRAIHVEFMQLFYLNKIEDGVFISDITRMVVVSPDNYSLHGFFDSMYFDIITTYVTDTIYSARFLYSSKTGELTEEKNEISTSVIVEGHIVDGNFMVSDGNSYNYDGGSIGIVLNDATYRFFAFFYVEELDYHSPKQSFIANSVNLEGFTYRISRNVFSTNLNSFTSGEIEVANIVATSDTYTIIDTKPFYSNYFSPSIEIYTDGNVSSIPGSVYSFARAIGLNTLESFMTYLCSVSFPESYYSSLDESISEEIFNIQLYYIEQTMDAVDGALYEMYGLEIGAKNIDDSERGLYRVFYVGEEHNTTSRVDAWYRPGSSISRISDWKFIGISFDSNTDNMFKMEDSPYSVILLSWENRPVNSFSSGNLIVSVPVFFSIRSKTSADFVYISPSSTGGSILHMHKTNESGYYGIGDYLSPSLDVLKRVYQDRENIADSHFASTSALVVSSRRYMYHASILNDAANGIVWDSTYIDNAKKYMLENEKYTLFFEENKYNPYQIGEVIRNHDIGYVNNEFFLGVEILSYDEVSFIFHESLDNDFSLVSVGEVVSLRILYIDDSFFDINSLISPVAIYGHVFAGIIDGCGKGTTCHNGVVRMPSTAIGISTPEVTYAIAGYDFIQEYPKFSSIFGEYSADDKIYHGFTVITPKNLGNIVSGEMLARVTIGTEYAQILYAGRMKIGEDSLYGILSPGSSVTVSVPNDSLSGMLSDFHLNLSIVTYSEFLKKSFGPEFAISIDKGRTRLKGVSEDEPSIWMKMFFPQDSDENFIEAPFMGMNVVDASFTKNMILPYKYVDTYIDEAIEIGKDGDNDLKEKKYKDIEDLGGDDIETPIDIICGQDRKMTYLDYQAFDHKLNFEEGNRLWGNYTKSFIEMINSPYLKIVENKVTMPGLTLSSAEAMSRATSEAILSRIDDLDEVYDWKIESFSLDKKDLDMMALDSFEKSNIEDSLKSSLNFVVNSLGEDNLKYEQNVTEKNMFPQFPDRPVFSGYLERTPVQQFILIRKYQDV
jgi:hypothetical protein